MKNLLPITGRIFVALFAFLVGVVASLLFGADPLLSGLVAVAISSLGLFNSRSASVAYVSGMPIQRGTGPTRKPTVMQGNPSFVGATDEKRAIYNRLRALYANNDRVVITEGYLRLEQAFTNQKVFSFPVLTNEGAAQSPTERRLAPADAFHVFGMTVSLGVYTTANGQGGMALEFFGNTQNLGANLAAFWTLYNGYVNCTIDSITFVKAMDLLSFRYVGATQTGRVPATGGVDTASEFNAKTMFVPIVPSFRLNGGSTNEVNIVLPANPGTITPPANSTLVVAVIFKGWLAQNGAEFNPRGFDE